MKKVLTGFFLFMSFNVMAQNDSIPVVTFSGYMETYYTYDFANPSSHNRPGFIYSHNRHNEFNLNLGFIKAAYQKNNVRANLALATGTYMNANLASEQAVMKNVFEANAGIRLSAKNKIWLDAGVFSSHIGFESAISKDCWNLTRSILADNSPYYESGIKLSYSSANDKWFLAALILNGWQHIKRPDGNNSIAVGHQLTYKPNSKLTLNSSSFVGNDKPDSVKRMRYFHNFYAQVQLSSKLGCIAGFDIGAEQKMKGSSDYSVWYSPVLILKLNTGTSGALAGRIEYYYDADGVIISTATANGFRTFGYSLNYDHAIRENILWRIEARGFSAKDKIFVDRNDDAVKGNFFVTTSLAISF